MGREEQGAASEPLDLGFGPGVEEVSRTPIGLLARWFFCLPVVLPLPDGMQIADRIGDQPRRSGDESDPIVSVIVHQVSRRGGALAAVSDAVFEAVNRDTSIATPGTPESAAVEGGLFPGAHYTVIEALTVGQSPDGPPPDWSGEPEDLSPRSDPLMRCIRFVDDLARAFRMAADRPQSRPTYPTVAGPVLCYQAEGEMVAYEHEDGRRLEVLRPADEWAGPQMIMLNHTNFLLDASPPEPMVTGPLAEVFAYRLESIRSGDRSVGWLERFLDAREALYVRGETGQAVVLACTAAEVLVTNTLTTLLWEDGVPVEEAASAWEDGKIIAAMTKRLAPRLKGSWSTSKGPVGDWYQRAYRLRHRVVHGGYEPSRSEAVGALEATHAFSRFIFDRIVAQRGVYPRTTLMTVAESGLRKRNLWTGKIKKFAEQVAPTEPLWQPALVLYNDELVQVRLSTLE